VRVRPTLPKDFAKEVIVFAHKSEESQHTDLVRITDMSHHITSHFDRVFE